MITFEDIQKANESITTLTIERYNKKTGKTVRKEYAEVNQRVKAFRYLYPEGTIKTIKTIDDGDRVCFTAEIYDGDNLLTTGNAEEIRNSSDINRTSAIENCETSAVGRALGFLGIGIDTSIASYEETLNAQMQQEGVKLASSTEKSGMIASAHAKGVDVDMLLSLVGFDRDKQPEGLNVEQYGRAMNYLNSLPKE